MVRPILFLVLAGAILISACGKPEEAAAPAVAAQTNAQRIFRGKGIIEAVTPAEKTVTIKHEEIPGFMPAMTMPFEVKNISELAGLAVGDSVTFRMVVTDKDGWIDEINKLGTATPTPLAAKGQLRIVRDVVPLDVGDPMPEYHFTNQFGRSLSTTQFKGQALAINFLFTRCPFPTFCPLTANNFSETQQKMLAMSNAPTNWQLLTISFDPEFDTPAILKGYGERYKYDPAHWSLVTGALIDITAIAEQFGQTFWHDETGGISHNLRTVIVDATGRVQRIIVGNKWNSSELADELVKGAKKK